MPKKFYKPSPKQIETLINLSEKYNSSREHYDIMIQLTTMGSADVSYAIDYIQRKNEYGRQALPINNKSTRAKNIQISEHPLQFQKEMEEKPLDNVYVGNLRDQFNHALRVKDYGRATILYITLVFDNKDKVFRNEVESKRDQLKAFFDYMASVPGRPGGVK